MLQARVRIAAAIVAAAVGIVAAGGETLAVQDFDYCDRWMRQDVPWRIAEPLFGP